MKGIGEKEALVVLGGLNAKVVDRELDRSQVRPVQVVRRSGIHFLERFDTWGELGVSSLAATQDEDRLFVSTGDDLRILDFKDGTTTEVDVADLVDVHEMTIVGDILWLANTGRNEAVGIDLESLKCVRRIDLMQYAVRALPVADDDGGDDTEVVYHFHCNQVFVSYEGTLSMLVHHVTGRQSVLRRATNVIKQQGNGGIVELETGRTIPLQLRGPHSVRLVNGFYWVFDSGNGAVNVYDKGWRLRARVPTAGFGRGADCSSTQAVVHCGMSRIRKRYAKIIPGARQGVNLVQSFDCSGDEPVSLEQTELEAIEQVNNVYVFGPSLLRRLMDH